MPEAWGGFPLREVKIFLNGLNSTSGEACYNAPPMILVTGATGFVGRVLVRQLTENGYPVRVLIRPFRSSRVTNFTRSRGAMIDR